MSWHGRFFTIAKTVAQWSKDPSSKIGAVLVRDRKVLATGYNGFPPGIADDDRLHDRDLKYRLIVHAEMNAILQAKDCEGASMYLWGMSGPPCNHCAKHLITAGVKRYYAGGGAVPDRWREDLEFSAAMLAEANVEVWLS